MPTSPRKHRYGCNDSGEPAKRSKSRRPPRRKASQQSVLVAPLDWGLGHATRVIPLIRYLLDTGRKVIIAADGRPRKLLEAEFPSLPIVRLPGYDIRYPRSSSMTTAMTGQLLKLIRGVWRERLWLKKWIASEKTSLVVSDNRFGLYHPSLPSIYITHQIHIQTPPRLDFLRPFLFRLHRWIIERYDECWIPDHSESPGLAGELSHGDRLPKNVRYIGPLTRFPVDKNARQTNLLEERLDLLAILSGPEPQRSLLEELLLKQLPKTNLTALIAAGRSEEDTDEWVTDRIRLVSRMTSEALAESIGRSDVLLSRPGYSTIMDIDSLDKPAIFIPTPGQTEQEYLGRLASERGAVVVKQSMLDVERDWNLARVKKYTSNHPVCRESFIPHLERLLEKSSR